MNELSVHAGATETPLPADFRWPGGKRLAVFFRCAFEGWSDGHWPGVGPMGNPLKPGVPDLNAIGFAEYGHRRGIFRVLETLGREGIKATMIVSGIMAERHAEIVRQISEAGHDIVAHSYAMDVIPIYLSEEEEAGQYPAHCRSDRARDRQAPDRMDQPTRHAESAYRPAAGGGRVRVARAPHCKSRTQSINSPRSDHRPAAVPRKSSPASCKTKPANGVSSCAPPISSRRSSVSPETVTAGARRRE
jgi:Polysaccharide deacetylase